MKDELRMKMLENAYASALADATLQFSKAGILKQVTAEKKVVQFAMGKRQAERFGITQPVEVFQILSEVFGCAVWELVENEGNLVAQTQSCKLCSMAKAMGSGCPCEVYCLNPMEGLIKAVAPLVEFQVEETLWDSEKCTVLVQNRSVGS